MIIAILLAVAGVLAGGAAAALLLTRVRGIRGQLLLLSLAAAVLPAAAVVGAGLIMFSAHDVLALLVLAAASAGTAAVLAALLASRLAHRVAAFRDAAAGLAAGDFAVRIPEEGPEELRELGVAFNRMTESLSRLFETRRNLVAWASHDLRAPLASLQVMIEALEDGLAQPAQYLPAMREQVRTLSRLVDDLFELSRIETGTLALALFDVRVDDLAARCISSLRPEADRRGVRLAVGGERPQAVAHCDPDKVERVLLNLLTNALRHTPRDGSIAVRVVRDGDAVKVAVEDTGRGVPAEAVGRVFESFWRPDPSRTPATGGSGLGLAIARGLVEAHGGRIWVENRPEGGARFSFTLPASATQAAAPLPLK